MNINTKTYSELSLDQIECVFGGGAMDTGYTFGGLIGIAYWGAREYMAGTVYPYYFD